VNRAGKPRRALLLFAHGAREPAWALPLEALAERLRRDSPGMLVRTAFLERMAPSLPEALGALADEGIREVAVLPVFWAAQGHLMRELPQLAAPARARGQQVRLLPTLSELPGMIDFVARAAAGLLHGAQSRYDGSFAPTSRTSAANTSSQVRFSAGPDSRTVCSNTSGRIG
jgi:sirohydrochlorin cobaltochelatase